MHYAQVSCCISRSPHPAFTQRLTSFSPVQLPSFRWSAPAFQLFPHPQFLHCGIYWVSTALRSSNQIEVDKQTWRKRERNTGSFEFELISHCFADEDFTICIVGIVSAAAFPCLDNWIPGVQLQQTGRNIGRRRGGRMDVEGKKGVVDQAELVAKAFVDHYYYMFDNNRQSLASLYHETSMLTFEGQKIQGAEAITAKLAHLPFNQCKHFISTMDCQPSPFAGGIIVFVSGSLQLQGEEHQLRFSQMFHLIPTLQGSFFVQNDIFRLNYG